MAADEDSDEEWDGMTRSGTKVCWRGWKTRVAGDGLSRSCLLSVRPLFKGKRQRPQSQRDWRCLYFTILLLVCRQLGIRQTHTESTSRSISLVQVSERPGQRYDRWRREDGAPAGGLHSTSDSEGGS